MGRKKRMQNAPPPAQKVPYENAVPYTEENLCTFVHNYEALWKPSHPNYYSDKTALWGHIAKKFQEEHVTGLYCLENYERLRDNRSQKLRRQQKSGSAGGKPVQAPKYLLWFLDTLKGNPSSRESSIVLPNAQAENVVENCCEEVHLANEQREADAGLRAPPPSTPQSALRRQADGAGGGSSSPGQVLLTPLGLAAQRARQEQERRQASVEVRTGTSPPQPAERRTARGRLLRPPCRFSPPLGVGSSAGRSRSGSVSSTRSTGSSASAASGASASGASGASITARRGRKRKADRPRNERRLSCVPEQDEVVGDEVNDGALRDSFLAFNQDDFNHDGPNQGSDHVGDFLGERDSPPLTESERRHRGVTVRRGNARRSLFVDHAVDADDLATNGQQALQAEDGNQERPLLPPARLPPQPTPQLQPRPRPRPRGGRPRQEDSLQRSATEQEEDVDDPGQSPPRNRRRAVRAEARARDRDHEEREGHLTVRQALAQAIEARRRADRVVVRRRQELDALEREEQLDRQVRQRQLQVPQGEPGPEEDTAEVRLLRQLVNSKQMDGADAFGITVADLLKSLSVQRRASAMTDMLHTLTEYLNENENVEDSEH